MKKPFWCSRAITKPKSKSLKRFAEEVSRELNALHKDGYEVVMTCMREDGFMALGKLHEVQAPNVQMIPIPLGAMMGGSPKPPDFKTSEAPKLIDAVIDNVDVDDETDNSRKHVSAILEHFLGDAPHEKLQAVLDDCKTVMKKHSESEEHKNETPAETAKCEVYRALQMLSVALELKITLQSTMS